MRRGIVILSVALAFPFPVHAAPSDPRLVQGILEWPAKLTVEPFLVIRTHDGEWLYTEIKAAKRLESGPLTAGAPVTVLGTEAKRPHEIKAVAVGSGDVAALALALALVPYVNPITVASGTPSAATPESQSPSKPRETESASTAKTAGKPEQAAAPAPPATPQPPPAPGSAAPASPKVTSPTTRKASTVMGAAPSEPTGQLRTAARVWAWPTGTPRWAELQGTVDAVADYWVAVRTDEGQLVLVDLSAVRSMAGSFTPGLPISVYGTPGESKFQAIGVILSDTRAPAKPLVVPQRR